MKYINFKTQKIENGLCHDVVIDLKIDTLLDEPVSVYKDVLEQVMRMRVKELQLEKIKRPVNFIFRTDLREVDLDYARDNIISELTRCLIKEEKTFKHGEKVLGVPKQFDAVHILIADLMDLINYSLITESFTITFKDKNDRKLVPIL